MYVSAAPAPKWTCRQAGQAIRPHRRGRLPDVRLVWLVVKFSRAMVVFAHPDDAEFGSAGTVAAWTREGTRVAYVCVTDGSAGSNEPGVTREELAPTREAEQRAAREAHARLASEGGE